MKLMDQVRAKMQLLHYAWDTEQSYVAWIERFIVFHKRGDQWRHPADGRARDRTIPDLLGP